MIVVVFVGKGLTKGVALFYWEAQTYDPGLLPESLNEPKQVQGGVGSSVLLPRLVIKTPSGGAWEQREARTKQSISMEAKSLPGSLQFLKI